MKKKRVIEITSKMIEEELKFKANTLHYYIQAGVIKADIDEGIGTGHIRKFSVTNYCQAAIVKFLMEYGLPKRSIVGMMKSILNAGDKGMLNPERLLARIDLPSDQFTYEYLIFIADPKKPEGFAHRFVSDSKSKKYLKTAREMGEVRGKTTDEGPESINDYLLSYHGCIVINLDSLFADFLNYLMGNYFTMTNYEWIIKK